MKRVGSSTVLALLVLSARASMALHLPAVQVGDGCMSSVEISRLTADIQTLVGAARWDALAQTAAQLQQRCPNAAPGHYWMGVADLRRGRLFASIRELRRALQLADTPGYHLMLAEAYLFLNQRQFFHEEIAAVLTRAPEQPGAQYLIGLYYYLVESNWEKAVGHFQQELAHDPNHFQAMCFLGLCYQLRGQNDQAEATFLNAVKTVDREKIESDQPFQLLASLYLDGSRAADALPYARRAVALSPRSAKNRFVLGKAAWGMGDQVTAVGALQAAAELDPTLPDPHYLLVRIYRARGEEAKARQEVNLFKMCKELYGTQ
ncbi:MAG: tetratricopeptide repeat protein [Acidobacteriia bacterium]|nr:tetratricopeptide repeat protein [Terriglobia bacterium]